MTKGPPLLKHGKDVRVLWHCNYWDGPLSGVCLCRDRKHWFRVAPGTEDDGVRLYLVHELTDEQIEAETYWHDLFREHVGTHTDYEEDGIRGGTVRPEKEWVKFYGPYNENKPKRTYGRNPIVGRFKGIRE